MDNIEWIKQQFLNRGIELEEEQAQTIYDYELRFAVCGIRGDFTGAVLHLATLGLSEEA